MKQSEWPLLLFRKGVAVTVAVHEGEYGRNTVLFRLLQEPEKPTSTAEYYHSGNELNNGTVMINSPCIQASEQV